MKSYDHKNIEKKWQKVWEKKKLYKADDTSKKPKFYGLIEFPFPSGAGMHVGHLRSNTGMDVIARKRRMEGYNVLYPIGWDAFGLPTENYAIKTGLPPQVVTKQNTDNFRKQLKSAGFSFDWSREINTTDPAYYKWTQWIFLQMYKNDLAYKKKMVINWCPKDKIGLANEEVVNGCCERCGTPVEKREKDQWMLAITKYADRLDKDLDLVDYQEKIKIQQRNWIGKSEGAEIDFELTVREEKVKVFTTRPDTIFGATYIVLSPEHHLIQSLQEKISNYPEVEKYISAAKKKDDIERTSDTKEKTGVELKGVKAINPATKAEIPVFVADYVLAHYGTGAVMAVPAHDERDYSFAKKYDLTIKEVIEPVTGESLPNEQLRKSIVAIVENPKTGKILCIDWTPKYGGMLFIGGGREENEDPADTALREIKEETGYKNLNVIQTAGKSHHHYFAFSKNVARNIEVIGVHLELIDEEKDEPSLEENEKNRFTVVWLTKDEAEKKVVDENHALLFQKFIRNKPYTGEGFLTHSNTYNGMQTAEAREVITKVFGTKKVSYKLRDWVFSRQRYWGEPIPMIYCPACAKASAGKGWVPVPEKDLPVVLPKVKNYQPTDSGESPLADISKWVNTKCPHCKGPAQRETDTMPNWAGSSWYYLRYIDPKNKKTFADPKKIKYWSSVSGEGTVDWYNGGMEHTTLHLLYSRFWHKFLFDLKLVPTPEPYNKRTSHGLILASDGSKISKSKGNSIDPDTIIDNVGADSLRLYEMFMGPFDQAVSWSDDGVVGPRRFLERVWKLQEKVVKKLPSDAALESSIHKTVKKVSEDIESMQFNTAISALMILLNDMDTRPQIAQSYYEHFLVLLAPFAPHIVEELWQSLGHKKSIHTEQWMVANLSKIVESQITLAIQINGKVRGELVVSPELGEEEITAKVMVLPEVKKWIEGKEIKKVIYVKGRVLNIVAV